MPLIQTIGTICATNNWPDNTWEEGDSIDSVPRALVYAMKKLATRQKRLSKMESAKSVMGNVSGTALGGTVAAGMLVGGLALSAIHPQLAGLSGVMAEYVEPEYEQGKLAGEIAGRGLPEGVGRTGRGMKSVYKGINGERGQHRRDAADVLTLAAAAPRVTGAPPSAECRAATDVLLEITGYSETILRMYLNLNRHDVKGLVEEAIKSTTESMDVGHYDATDLGRLI
jgi:hypothetical protein